MLNKFIGISVAALLVSTGAAHAGEIYIGGSVGYVDQGDSANRGQTGAFTTGNLGDGSTLDVAAGTDYGWDTEFDSGVAFSAEIGKRKQNGLRLALELVNTSADVDTHKDVTLGGGAIGTLDAAAIAGSPDPLGVTIADVVADGRGEINQTGLFANAYYDFPVNIAVKPYVGGGIGVSFVDVDYSPSDIAVIDQDETLFAYQVKAGASYQLSSPIELFGEVAYRATDDFKGDNVLFPGSLDIENTQTTFSIGARYTFN